MKNNCIRLQMRTSVSPKPQIISRLLERLGLSKGLANDIRTTEDCFFCMHIPKRLCEMTFGMMLIRFHLAGMWGLDLGRGELWNTLGLICAYVGVGLGAGYMWWLCLRKTTVLLKRLGPNRLLGPIGRELSGIHEGWATWATDYQNALRLRC